MKKTYLSLFASIAISSAASAQCTGRYAANVYTTYSVTTGIQYGSNLDYTSTSTTLTLDFYQPTADTARARPLIIWAHGGSFIQGTSADVDVTSLSQHFALKGYACASINYRIGVSSFDSVGLNQAVVRAVQDMKAAIRFFYKDKKTVNNYKIDTNNIFIGGSSAGSITALHTEYLDRACKIYPYVDSTTLLGLGGLNGNSGNPGYSQKVKGVIDLCGGLGVYAWLEAGNTPLCSMHGTSDATVPYSRGIVNPGIPIQYIDGSRMIYKRALCVGVQDNFYTWLGAPHVPFSGTNATQLAYMDTTVNFVRDFLLQRLNISCSALQAPNTPYGTATLYSYTGPCVSGSDCLAGIEKNNPALINEIYPNPSTSDVHVVFANTSDTHYMELTDVSGRILKSATSSDATFVIERANLNAGVYFLKVSNKQGDASIQKIIFY